MPITRNCDICRVQDNKEVPAIYDAKTKRGPWGYLCQNHMDTEGHPGYKTMATKLSEVK